MHSAQSALRHEMTTDVQQRTDVFFAASVGKRIDTPKDDDSCRCAECMTAPCTCKSPSTGTKIKHKLEHGLMAVGIKKDTRPEKPSDAAWETMEQAELDMRRREEDEERRRERMQQDVARESRRRETDSKASQTAAMMSSEGARMQKAGQVGAEAAADARIAMERDAEDRQIEAERKIADQGRPSAAM